MSATYWVIREGKVRGQGRYWSNMYGWGPRWLATPLKSRDWSCENGRVVRVTRKPKAEAWSETSTEYLTMLAAQRKDARRAALDEAIQLLRERFEGFSRSGLTPADAVAVLKDDVAAIAALKGGAK